jgi:hypothetical protein
MEGDIQKGSVVYIRYWDHVLYKNTFEPVINPVEREAIGWLVSKSEEAICIQNDRTLDELPYHSGTCSGLVLLTSCIIESYVLPLQNFSRWSLSFRDSNIRNAESALQTKKR